MTIKDIHEKGSRRSSETHDASLSKEFSIVTNTIYRDPETQPNSRVRSIPTVQDNDACSTKPREWSAVKNAMS